MGKFCKDTLCERRNLEQTLFKLDQRKKNPGRSGREKKSRKQFAQRLSEHTEDNSAYRPGHLPNPAQALCHKIISKLIISNLLFGVFFQTNTGAEAPVPDVFVSPTS